MTQLIANLSVSLDGFVAGPDPSSEHPLGIGGEQLHEWALKAMAWREQHGRAGGEAGVDVGYHALDRDRARILRIGLPDRYVTHGKPSLLREEVGLTGSDVAERVLTKLGTRATV